MIKSISKLIIAGMALSLTVPAGAQQKAMQPNPAKSSVSSRVKAAPQGKRVKMMEGLLKTRTHQSKSGSQLAEAGKFSRPLNFKLDRASAPLHVASSTPVNGVVIFADSWTPENAPYGVYSFPTDGSSNESTEIALINELAGTQTGVAVGDRYYAYTLQTFLGMFIIGANVQVYDVNTWELVQNVDVMEDLTRLAVSTAYDEATGKIYGQFYTADLGGLYFGMMDPDTFEVTPIAQSGMQFNAMAFAPDGTLYVIGIDGSLYNMNKETGDLTLIGSTGYQPQYFTGGAIDQKTGRFYWSLSNDEGSYMFDVNTSTGQAQLLYEIADNEEVVGMWVPKPAAEDGAPNQVTDLKANYAEGSLAGTISFTAPTTLFDGTAAAGNFTYVVKANNEEIATGTVAAGADVTCNYTAPASGTYRFTVYCVNEVGNGAPASVRMYIGVDSPLDPENVELKYADNKMTLTWDAAAGAHEGYLGQVKYTVTRYESGKEPVVVKEGLTECTYTEEFTPASEDFISVYYTVAASTETGASSAVASNSVAMGAIIPPYSNSFVSNPSVAGYTIIDNNGDGTTWSLTSNGLSISFNSDMDMDDWVITPAVKLEAGKYYSYTVEVGNNSSSYVERVEVMAGREAAADAMTIEVVAATDIQTGGTFDTLEGAIIPEETGNYYIGIHGISEPDMYTLNVKEYSISEGFSTAAPDAATNLTVTPNVSNFYEAAVTFNAPAKTIVGAALTSIDKLVVTRTSADGESKVVYTADNVTPGAEITFNDTVETFGTYTYSVLASCAAGEGLAATISAYVGIPVAAAPAEATVVATDNTGEVKITWSPVTTSADGLSLPAEYITYTVINNDGEVIGQGLTECSITTQAVTEGQDFVQYGVYAVTEGGDSEMAVTDMIAVGTPYELPYKESFDNAGLSYGMATARNGAQWMIVDDTEFERELTDADGTNGYAYMEGDYAGGYADLYTGIINLNAEAPAVGFSYYNLGAGDENEIEVFVMCDGQTESVGKVVMNQNGDQAGWNKALFSLKKYAGKDVQIVFRGITVAFYYTFLDAISIEALKDYDLKITSVNAPAEVNPDEDFAITADVLNMGGKEISDYKVELYLNGKLIAEKEGVKLDSGEEAVFSFEQNLNVTAAERNVYTVNLVCDLDDNKDDNTVEYPVILNLPNYPVARELKATLQSDGIALTWAEPDTDGAAPTLAVTEDFESYSAWETENLGQWTLVDEDGFTIGGVQGVQFGPIVPGETTCAYFLMNDTQSDIADNANYMAHSGHQYLVSTFSYSQEGANADWLISPMLSGYAQTVSFYVKSFNGSYLEDFKVLYSTTDTDITSFTEVAYEKNVPNEWTAYSVNIPSGARYFAIECVSNDKFMFMLDDVTYAPADGESLDLSIVGYNIYRNGVKLNDTPVAETAYFDPDGTTSDFYCVTVVYTLGESAPSLVVGVGTPGVPSTLGIGDIVNGETAVKVADRTIVVTNAHGTVAVYAADGKAVYSEAAAKTNTVTVTPGVYVVKAGERVTKVIVK